MRPSLGIVVEPPALANSTRARTPLKSRPPASFLCAVPPSRHGPILCRRGLYGGDADLARRVAVAPTSIVVLCGAHHGVLAVEEKEGREDGGLRLAKRHGSWSAVKNTWGRGAMRTKV